MAISKNESRKINMIVDNASDASEALTLFQTVRESEGVNLSLNDLDEFEHIWMTRRGDIGEDKRAAYSNLRSELLKLHDDLQASRGKVPRRPFRVFNWLQFKAAAKSLKRKTLEQASASEISRKKAA